LLAGRVRQPEDGRVARSRQAVEGGLDVGGVDVLPFGRDDDVLDAPLDDDAALRVDLADVAGAEPLPALLLAEIPGGDVAAAHLDLAVGAEADLLSLQRPADVSLAPLELVRDRHDRRGLGEAV